MRFSGFDDEWKKSNLGNISSNEMYGMNSAAKDYDGFNKYIRITDISETSNKFIPNPLTSPDGDLEDKYKLKKGDIVFARTGASTGKTYLYDDNDRNLYFAGFLIKFHIDNADPKFIFYNTLKEEYLNWVSVMSVRSGQPGINSNEYKKLPIILPSLDEQNKISNFLTSIDKKIDLLERKHQFYQEFKKYLMQQIFTQKLRFADCTGEWNLFKLGDIVELMRNGCSENQVSFETEFPVTRIETISKGILNFDKVGYVEKIDSSYLLQYGDILLSNINSLKYIGNCVFFDEDKPLYHGMNLMLMRFKDDFNKKYLFYYMKFYQQWFQKMACQAVNQASINQSSLKKFPFYIPPTIDEQNKIVNVIDDTEHKINSIEDQIIKMEEFKKGLLQQMFVVQLILSLLQNKKHI